MLRLAALCLLVVAYSPMVEEDTLSTADSARSFAAVLQIAEAGLVNLDDMVDQYVDLRPCGRGIAIRNLWGEIRDHFVDGPAFGGLVGTARGFGKSLQDQLRSYSRLFSDSTLAILCSPARTRQGVELSVSLGRHMGRVRGVRFIYEEGDDGGFHCMMRVSPTSGLATVVMTNSTSFNVRRLLDALRAYKRRSRGGLTREPQNRSA